MSDFVKNLKKNAEKIIDTTNAFTKATIKKTSESVNSLKLKYSIKDIESNIDDVYKALGKMIYKEYLNGAEFEGGYLEKCERIDEHFEEIEILNVKLAEIGNGMVCPDCKKHIPGDSKFCPGCGYKFEIEEW